MGDRPPCHAKRRYKDGSTARSQLRAIRGRGYRSQGGKPGRAYPCPYCKGWHLTSDTSGADR